VESWHRFQASPQGQAHSGAAPVRVNGVENASKPIRKILLIERLPGQTDTALLHVKLCIRQCPVKHGACYFLRIVQPDKIVLSITNIRSVEN
jgi:hypothetical protein